MTHIPTAFEPPAVDVESLRTLIAYRLGRWDRRRSCPTQGVRQAAVCVTLLDKSEAPQVLIIKRVARGMNPGQWALPGGKVDAGEGTVEGALRELKEETGLVAADDDVLGKLDDFVTSSGFVITPIVVAIGPGQQARRNPGEIAALHPIPLSRLLEPGVPRWQVGNGDARVLQMPLRHDMVIHAPTGAILWQFAEVALRGVPRRVMDLVEPAFTAR